MIVETKGDNVRPKHLELYSCEGGSATGYDRAGFDVYCVDLFEDFSQKRCPFPSHKGDVLDVLRRLLAGEAIPFTHLPTGAVEWLSLSDFASIGASPPCQHASAGTRAQDRSRYPRLIEPTRALLQQTGLPYVIENVKGADLHDPILLCGSHFALAAYDEDNVLVRLERHRLFESNIPLRPAAACYHDKSIPVAGVYGGSRRAKRLPGESLSAVAPRDRYAARVERGGGYVPRSKPVQQRLLGIDWMTVKGMRESIPPAYTEHIGRQLLAYIAAKAA